MLLHFLDGTELRAAELRRIAPTLRFELASLPVGYSTSAPDPAQRARDMVLASTADQPCFAEAVDLVTADGKSLRLELDSETHNRFCRWLRETPVRLQVCVALRRELGAAVELFAGECAGQVADKPAGSHTLGWDRLFVPTGFQLTLAQLCEHSGSNKDAVSVGLREQVYGDLARAIDAVVIGPALSIWPLSRP
jgi:hypothetical protein